MINSPVMRILIIEPEESAFRDLVHLIQEVEPVARIEGHVRSASEANKWLLKHKTPDLVFSVINLPDGLSFQIFNELENKPPVIFTCKNEKYALAAFNTTGIYYLLKPYKKEQLEEALRKFKLNTGKSIHDILNTRKSYQKRFLVNIGKQSKLIPAEEIAYFYTDKKILYLVCFDSSKYILNSSLEKLEAILDPENFFRINRQFIVNLSSITKMTPASKSRQQLFLKPKPFHSIITSAGRTSAFYKWLVGDLNHHPGHL
jgi:DNA-binding LytR/AlgR family response regulator